MNRTVAVIGGSGKLGRAVVAALIEEGWTVVNFDRVPSSDSRARFIRTDLTDYGQVVEASPALMRCTAASMPSSISPPFPVRPSRPTSPRSTTTWRRPSTSSRPPSCSRFTIWSGPRARRCLSTRSTTHRRTCQSTRTSHLHPDVVYSLAKDLEEEMARQYCRWNPDQKMIGLRFSNVIDPSEYTNFPSFEDNPASRKWNLWSYIDARDGAQAIVRALGYDKPGFDHFVIANADTVMSRPSTELMAEFFPMTEFRAPVDGTQSLCSIDKARRLLGWSLSTHGEITHQPDLFGDHDVLGVPPSGSGRGWGRLLSPAQRERINTCPALLVRQTTPTPPTLGVAAPGSTRPLAFASATPSPASRWGRRRRCC